MLTGHGLRHIDTEFLEDITAPGEQFMRFIGRQPLGCTSVAAMPSLVGGGVAEVPDLVDLAGGVFEEVVGVGLDFAGKRQGRNRKRGLPEDE